MMPIDRAILEISQGINDAFIVYWHVCTVPVCTIDYDVIMM